MNGEALNVTASGTTLTLDSPGSYQLVVMDEEGQSVVFNFELR